MRKPSSRAYLLNLSWKKLSLRSVLRTEQCFHLREIELNTHHGLAHARSRNAHTFRVGILVTMNGMPMDTAMHVQKPCLRLEKHARRQQSAQNIV